MSELANSTALLDGLPPVLPFTGKPDGFKSSTRASLPIQIDSQIFSELPTRERDAEAVLLAVWQTLIWRYTGQSEIVVGRIHLTREEGVSGNSIDSSPNVTPVAVRFASDSLFPDIVRQVLDGVAANRNGGVRVSSAGPHPAMGFIYGETSPSTPQLFSYAKKFDLSICVQVHSGVWNVQLFYDPGWLAEDAVARIARSYATMVLGAVANPNCCADALPVLSGEDHELVVNTFNQSGVEYPDVCVHQLFEEQVRRTPKRSALRFRERTLTYEQLNGRANQLAHGLRKCGVGPDVPVAMFVERSAEMIIGMLAIMKAGGAYVPLLHDDPQARVAHLLAEVKAPALLTSRKLQSLLPEYSGKIVLFDDAFAEEPASDPENKTNSGNLVCVIYTSGSTGVPKGVAARHSNLANYAQFICKRLELARCPEGWHFATVSTIGAILGNTSVFASLMSGGCLHVIDYETGMTPRLFAEYVANHPIDVIKITPSQLSALLAGAEGQPIMPRRYVVVGGEKFTWELVQQIRDNGSCKIMNHFGPTETMGCCTFVLDGHDFAGCEPATVPLGRPMSNQQLYIVDRYLRPVPIGVAGELCMSGAGLTAGYFNQPQQTAEKFVPNPFSSKPGARLYRTGDLARFLPDGNIEFLGRIDHQVKIRGFRVEPAEVEAVAKQLATVKDAVVVPEDNATGEKILAAYVVPVSDLQAGEMRSSLREQLPDYMVPSRVVILPKLPLNRNGKIDLPALSSLQEEPESNRADLAGPRTPAEELLVTIWKDVLQKEQVGIHDDFFASGGHSLLAMQLLSQIRNEFRVEFPLFSFLEAPTIADVAAKLAECPAAETEQEEMQKLLSELEAMSDEEAKRLAGQESGISSPVRDNRGE